MQVHYSQMQQDHRRVRRMVVELSEFMERFGYTVLDVPIIESADLFLTKAGDQIIKKLFTFERHNQELALRPEFTAPAAYYYVTNHAEQPVVRWQFNGPIFEDDPQDAARNYQRFSIGAELIGMPGSGADAEIIAIAAGGMRLLEISDWRLVIGHAGLTRHLLARFNLDTRIERFLLGHLSAIKAHGKAYVLEQLYETVPSPGAWTSVSDLGTETSARVALHALLDASPRGVAMGSRTREDIARRLLQKQRRAADRDRIESALDFLEQWAAISGTADEIFPVIDHLAGSDDAAKRTIRDLRSVVDLLAVYDISSAQIRIQPGLVRSWEYYTGVVFELRGDRDLPLGGGGRYDELVRLIGGQEDVPAVGFAYYVDAVLAALPKSDSIRRSALLIPVDATNGNPAARWAQELRLRGVTAVLIPDQSYSHRERLLTVEMDASAQFRGKTYTLAQVSALVAALSETTYDQ